MTEMADMNSIIPPLLEVNNLSLTLKKNGAAFSLLQKLSFQIYPGEILGLVGESGCGKSLTASAIMQLLPDSQKLTGEIKFEGKNLLDLSPKELSLLRGNRISLILQDPSLSLNPLMPIGKQLTEGLMLHKKIGRKHADLLGLEWLQRVGISDPQMRMRQYPHEISGGMKQRILIAMALIGAPSLIIADEPTTALDVTIQKQILDLLQVLQRNEKMSLLLISHDLGVIARLCQRVMVMYAGHIVEIGSVEGIFNTPKHPYTKALLESRRSIHQPQRLPLICLEGNTPQLNKETLQGCPFGSRCANAMQICAKKFPPSYKKSEGSVSCWLPFAPKIMGNQK